MRFIRSLPPRPDACTDARLGARRAALPRCRAGGLWTSRRSGGWRMAPRSGGFCTGRVGCPTGLDPFSVPLHLWTRPGGRPPVVVPSGPAKSADCRPRTAGGAA